MLGRGSGKLHAGALHAYSAPKWQYTKYCNPLVGELPNSYACRVDELIGEPPAPASSAAQQQQQQLGVGLSVPAVPAAATLLQPVLPALPHSQHEAAEQTEQLLARLSVVEATPPAVHLPSKERVSQLLLGELLSPSEPRTTRQLTAAVQQRSGVHSALGEVLLARLVGWLKCRVQCAASCLIEGGCMQGLSIPCSAQSAVAWCTWCTLG